MRLTFSVAITLLLIGCAGHKKPEHRLDDSKDSGMLQYQNPAAVFDGNIIIKSCTFKAREDYPFKKNFVCATDGGEILATVRLSEYSHIWYSYIGGNNCGSGEFPTEKSARECVAGVYEVRP